MMGRVALTERFAKSATTGGRKSPIFYDDEVIGSGLQVRDNSRKILTLTTPSRAGAGATFMGDHPSCSVQAGSDEAKRGKRGTDAGPWTQRRRDVRVGPVVCRGLLSAP